MTPIALQQLREQTDDRWAAIMYWLQEGGRDQLTSQIRKHVHGDRDRVDDVFGRVMAELYDSKSEVSAAAIEACFRGDVSPLEGLAVSMVPQLLSLNSSANRSEQKWSVVDELPEDKANALADESLPDPIANIDGQYLSALLVDGLQNALTRVQRDELILHFCGGKSFEEIGRMTGSTKQAAHKRHDRALAALTKFVSTSEMGERCPEIAATFTAVLAGAEVDKAELAAAWDHAEHCSACKQVLTEGHDSLRRAALFFPLPVAITLSSSHSWLGGVLDGIKGTWVNLTSRGTEVASAGAHPGWQSAKPVATVSAFVLLVSGGAYTMQQRAEETPKKPVQSQRAPKLPPRLYDPIPVPKQHKKKPSKPKTKTPAPVQPTPTPAPPVATPAPTPTRIDDGSSEFSPEGR